MRTWSTRADQVANRGVEHADERLQCPQPQPPPPQQPPVPTAGAGDEPARPVIAIVDSSFTVSSCPLGHCAGSAASAIGRDSSNVAPHARHR